MEDCLPNKGTQAGDADLGGEHPQIRLDRTELLAAIVDSALDAVVGVSLQGRVQSWNAAAERLFGYTASEMAEQPTARLLPADRAGEETAILGRIQRGERVEPFETVRVGKEGQPIPISLSVSPIRTSAGRLIGVSYIAHATRAPISHELAAAQLAAIVESSDDAIVSKDLNGIIQSWNRGAERIYGYTEQEVLGQCITLLLPPERSDEEKRILARIRAGNRVDHFETVRVSKNGRRIDISLSTSPIRNRTGQIVGASHIARDITERTRVETATAQLAAIIEFSEDAIISKDLEGIILTWNKAAERIYGYPVKEALGRPMTILLPPDKADEETAVLSKLKRGESVEHFETVRVRKDGRRIDVSLTISPIRDEAGKILGASHVARDITDRKNLETQLRETQKLESLGVLAGGVAHDFNNLLTGILGNSSLVLDSLPDASPNRKLLQDVVKASERAAALTRQLLAYAGKGRFVTEAVNLSELTLEISRLIETSIPRKVQLRLDLQPDLPPIEGDVAQLQQVIMNVVINGAEAIGDQTGAVLVTTKVQDVDDAYIASVWGKEELKPGRYVVLEVHDTGCGMDQATLSKIFDPFFTTKFTGRGLGLAAVLGIVRSHKGALKVYSTPGEGSTFKLLFPVAQQDIPALHRETHTDLEASGTILVVDDEEIVRETAKSTLQRYGYKVIAAVNGQDAVKLFQAVSDEIVLVLLDLTMPVMDGEEALLHLKSIRPAVPVLLSSGFNEVESVRRFTGKGLAGFIQKPYSALQLADKVRSVITKARAA